LRIGPFIFQFPSRGDYRRLKQKNFFWDDAIVGGPAVKLTPDYFNDLPFVKIGNETNGVLQRYNKLATKTSIGCYRKCEFCAVPDLEGKIFEFDEWKDNPILIDNNILATSKNHFDKVIDRLIKWKWADFNQGLDTRILSSYHAKRFAEIEKPILRLALDNFYIKDQWISALKKLMKAGIAKKYIRSYALIGFDSNPQEAWERCNFIEKNGIKVSPSWFHELDALKKNQVTEKQKKLGWTDYERRKIMQWFFYHKKAIE
jgi:hypothetical protein